MTNLQLAEKSVPAYLYVNSRGYEVTKHSYSGSETYQFCPKKYHLQRVLGYHERGQKASLEFGKAIEAAIARYHISDVPGAMTKFDEMWYRWQNEKLIYTATEESWAALSATGHELIWLYHYRLPFFPYVARGARFQVMYTKEVFPGTPLAGIEFVSYIDMITKFKDSGKPLLIDIKTSGTMYSTEPGIHALDQQLRTYAYITGIPDVGFLVLKKEDRAIGRGSWVSVLQGVSIGRFEYNAGNQAVVVKVEEADNPHARAAWIVKPDTKLDDYIAAGGHSPQSKAGKEAKQLWLQNNAALVPVEILTKQRIQFLTAHVDTDAQQEAASQIGEDIALIVRANQTNTWKKQGGTRFPNNKCTSCCMRGICLKNDKLRDELVERDDKDFDFALEELTA